MQLNFTELYQKLQEEFYVNVPFACSQNTIEEAVQAFPHLLLRFLKYDWQSSGKYLAKPHFDAGSFTLAIAESSPGLRIGSCPENLKQVNHKAGNAIFMLASNFQKIMDTQELSAGWHDVIQTDQTLIGKPYARWAIVAFIEGHGIEALSRSETHKWYVSDDVG